MKPIEEKAIRLIVEERVRITGDSSDDISAKVQGDTGIYQVLWSPDPERSTCSCKANQEGHRKCSHLLAVELDHLAKEKEEQ